MEPELAPSHWQWPDIEGLDTFGGIRLHTAAWDDKVDLQGKRVGVIGNGSSGIQIVTAIQPGMTDIEAKVACQRLIINRRFLSRPLHPESNMDRDHFRTRVCRHRWGKLRM